MALTPTQRLQALADPASVLEIAGAARSQQPAVAAETPRDGVLTAFATIGGRRAAVIVEDADALACTDAEVARRKRHRILTLALMTDSPIVLVVDGSRAGSSTFGDNTGELAGRMSDPRLDVDIGRRRAPLITVVCGAVVAWARDVVADADVVIATEAAQRELADRSRGIVDVVVTDDNAAMAAARTLLSLLGPHVAGEGTVRFAPTPLPAGPEPVDSGLMADPARVVDLLVDAGSFVAFQRPDGSGLLTGVARIGGWPVVLAVTGGADSAQLTSLDLARLQRVYRLAGRNNRTLAVVQDCAGYAPDAAADLAGLAALVGEIRACDAPVVTIVSGRGHTLGTFPLGTKQLGATFIIAWPWAQLAITDARAYTPEALDEVRRPDPWLAAGRGLVDDVLTPAETVQTVRQLVALFGERWEPVTRRDRPNAVIV
jgi:acetyl-CoA carboxylase carboxyltransferase component